MARRSDRSLERLRQQFRGRRVLLGVDRLDYSKGILARLRAIELLLERLPALRRTIAFVQVAVPSRDEIREYQELRQGVEELVGHINGRFTEPGYDVPVHYLHRSLSRVQLLAYYRLADVCLVTPLADGMNLVAKEFVTVQAAVSGTGALVLSEFTGAATELTEALPCNPFDVTGPGRDDRTRARAGRERPAGPDRRHGRPGRPSRRVRVAAERDRDGDGRDRRAGDAPPQPVRQAARPDLRRRLRRPGARAGPAQLSPRAAGRPASAAPAPPGPGRRSSAAATRDRRSSARASTPFRTGAAAG